MTRIFCAHADQDGLGAHWKQEDWPCPLECEHDSLEGVDQAEDGPDKVWECCACHGRFRHVEQFGLSRLVPVRGA